MADITVYGEYASIDDGGDVEAEVTIDNDTIAQMKADAENGEILDIYYIKHHYPGVFYDMEDAICQAALEINDDVVEYCVISSSLEDLFDVNDEE